MLGKIILWIATISFISYGLTSLFSPEVPAGYAGLSMTNGDAYAEIGAMYGGLQTGFGLFLLLGILKADLYRPALGLLVMVIGSLALGRLYWTIAATDPVGVYTYGAMAFEFTIAILAALALRKH